MNNSFYITTTIPYVNAAPHVGFALELVQADVFTRWRKTQGFDVRLQTGSDENSLKNVLAAEARGLSTHDLVAANAERFLTLQRALNIEADDFIRTSSDARHRPAVEKLWNVCKANGDLYQKTYTGLYCTGCEQFYNENDLVEGCCPDHGTRPERVEETNWFFKLSRYSDALRSAISTDKLLIQPEVKKNEILALIDQGLEDFSVSRDSERARGWGIPVPKDEDQTIYVWFDALGNYISALGYAEDNQDFTSFWTEARERQHVVGKGVTRFHAVYWPAILLSAGLPLPTRIFVHGYLTVDGNKIGKSNGNAIDPVPVVEQYGADALRYYLLRHIRSSEDGDFSLARLEQAYSSELAGGIGNLVQRVLAIVHKQNLSIESAVKAEDSEEIAAVREVIEAALDEGAFHIALAEILSFVGYANRVTAELQPWKLAKAAADTGGYADLISSLSRLVGLISVVGDLCRVFLPETAGRIDTLLQAAARGQLASPEPLFPKIG